MTVQELNYDQLSQLKQNLWFASDGDDWFYDQLSQEDKDIINECPNWDSIPDEVAFRAYEGVSFVDEDFCISGEGY